MATIIRHRESGGRYILLGAGYGAWKALPPSPSPLIGRLYPPGESGELTALAVCDAEGKIGWVPSEEVEIVEVDGHPPRELL